MKRLLELQRSLVQYTHTLVRPCPSWLDRYKAAAAADPLAKESPRDGHHEKAEVAKHMASSFRYRDVQAPLERRVLQPHMLFSQANAVYQSVGLLASAESESEGI